MNEQKLNQIPTCYSKNAKLKELQIRIYAIPTKKSFITTKNVHKICGGFFNVIIGIRDPHLRLRSRRGNCRWSVVFVA